MTIFGKLYQKFLAALVILFKSGNERKINQFIDETVTSLYSQFFAKNMIVNTGLVEKEVIKLGNFYKIPYKFNKDVFNAIQGRSLLSNNSSWTNAYTTKQKNRLKRIISKALYEEKTEKEVADLLRKDLFFQQRRTQLIARTEMMRAKNTAVSMTWDTLDHNKYEKVWINNGSNVRDTHVEMEGAIADPATGLFTTTWGEYLSVPGSGSDTKNNINCKCSIVIREKIEKKQ